MKPVPRLRTKTSPRLKTKTSPRLKNSRKVKANKIKNKQRFNFGKNKEVLSISLFNSMGFLDSTSSTSSLSSSDEWDPIWKMDSWEIRIRQKEKAKAGKNHDKKYGGNAKEHDKTLEDTPTLNTALSNSSLMSPRSNCTDSSNSSEEDTKKTRKKKKKKKKEKYNGMMDSFWNVNEDKEKEDIHNIPKEYKKIKEKKAGYSKKKKMKKKENITHKEEKSPSTHSIKKYNTLRRSSSDSLIFNTPLKISSVPTISVSKDIIEEEKSSQKTRKMTKKKEQRKKYGKKVKKAKSKDNLSSPFKVSSKKKNISTPSSPSSSLSSLSSSPGRTSPKQVVLKKQSSKEKHLHPKTQMLLHLRETDILYKRKLERCGTLNPNIIRRSPKSSAGSTDNLFWERGSLSIQTRFDVKSANLSNQKMKQRKGAQHSKDIKNKDINRTYAVTSDKKEVFIMKHSSSSEDMKVLKKLFRD